VPGGEEGRRWGLTDDPERFGRSAAILAGDSESGITMTAVATMFAALARNRRSMRKWRRRKAAGTAAMPASGRVIDITASELAAVNEQVTALLEPYRRTTAAQQGLDLDDFSRQRIDASVAELIEERDAVVHLLARQRRRHVHEEAGPAPVRDEQCGQSRRLGHLAVIPIGGCSPVLRAMDP